MAMEPIRRKNISDEVFSQFKEQIASGEWKPGDKLPSENELCEILQVSRVTVRQALQRLAALGLVETRLGEGTFVRSLHAGLAMQSIIPAVYLGENSLRDVLEFRKVVEGSTAALAAQKADDADIRALESCFSRMDACRDDVKSFSGEDTAFHKQLAEITRNPLIIATYEIISDILQAAMEQIVERRGFVQGLLYHSRILEAVRNRDPGEARRWMEEHVDDTYESMLGSGLCEPKP